MTFNPTTLRCTALKSKTKSKTRFMPMPMPMLKSLRSIVRTLGSASRQLLALTLVMAFVAGPTAPLFAQVVPAAPMMLHITILDGEDALNNIRERTAREPIVQVEDENHKPVAGALLIFSIQNGGSGASGTFNGLSSLSVTTDAEGKAVAHGLKPNQTAGTYTIAVTATLGALVATAIIHQSNIAGGGGGAGSTPENPGTPGAPGTPGTPALPGAPGTPGAPVSPGVPGSPVTPGIPGTPATPGTPVTPNVQNPSGTPGAGSAIKKASRLGRIPKKVWITGATIVTVGVVVGVVVATRGNSPTTITPGTGTVGP